MTTYISKIAKNGRHQYFRVADDGKKKMIKREEYEANAAKESVTFCEMHKPDGCHECPNRYVCENCDTKEAAVTFAEVEVNDCQNDLPTETVTPFDFVKFTVGGVVGKYKLTFKDWKTYASVYYRSAAIIGFVFDESHNITAVRFMGTTLETRKAVIEHKIENPSDLSGIMGFIRRQIEFINWWWDNPQATSGGVA
jgi:hypothetical protein